jgi:hypothetical protein
MRALTSAVVTWNRGNQAALDELFPIATANYAGWRGATFGRSIPVTRCNPPTALS